MSNFTQPICSVCYLQQYPGRVPHRLKEEYREEEICCYCGHKTSAGIYTRVDPKTVKFATIDEGDAEKVSE